MLRNRLTAIVTAIATVVALPAGASAASTQARDVCASHTYVTERPASIPVDSLFEGETVDVQRYSPSRQWAYGKPRGSKHAHLNGGGWVKVSDLCATGSSSKAGSSSTKSKRYSVRIDPGTAATGPVYVGGISNITVKDTKRAGQRLKLCITPAPTERPSCRSGRTGRTIDTIAWSQAGPTKVRIAIEGGPVIVKTVNVRPAQQ